MTKHCEYGIIMETGRRSKRIYNYFTKTVISSLSASLPESLLSLILRVNPIC